jgi:hypothetical protein
MTSNRNGFPTDRGAERARWVSQYRGSGVSLKEFAQRHGLSEGQLRYWVYGLAKGTSTKEPGLVFQEVRLPTPALSPGSWSTEIGLPNGTTVRLARETDVAWAMALIDSLRRPCSP